MNALLALIEHTEDCDKFTGAGTSCTCGADKAKDVYNELVNDNAALRAREVCTGCGTKKIDAILAVINGAAACCPDCSTLTVDERNAIRARVGELEWERDRYQSMHTKQLDYSIALQRSIEYHSKGKVIPQEIAVCCPHHADMLNAVLAKEAKA